MKKNLEVVLYTRPGCHLCEEAKTHLAPILRKAGVVLLEKNIDADPELKRLYDVEVPVLFIAGRRVAKHRVDVKQFERQLQEALELHRS
ncbi:MAG: glutaredoxin family protein [Acidobacteria bacterium]|nr:glutaredoxin family protein [Acidobacteriota bacterium]